jgi:hypothetical protein
MASKSNQENDHDIDDDHHEIKKATPAVIRTRQFRNFFPVSSPSDNIMSPCTQKLVGARIGTGPYETRNLKTSDNLPINSKITQTKQMDGNKLDFGKCTIVGRILFN